MWHVPEPAKRMEILREAMGIGRIADIAQAWSPALHPFCGFPALLLIRTLAARPQQQKTAVLSVTLPSESFSAMFGRW